VERERLSVFSESPKRPAIWREEMKEDLNAALAERHLLLQAKYLRVKEELEKFLKKKTGYRELRDLMKEISSEPSTWGDHPENNQHKEKEDS